MRRDTETGPISAGAWFRAAYEMFIACGIESVRIQPLAKKLNVSRTSFYWHFKDRSDLLQTLLNRGLSTNTDRWVGRTLSYADSACEAVLNVLDCWFDVGLVDWRYEAATRAWAQKSPAVAQTLAVHDADRITSLAAMFERFDCTPRLSDTRARTVYYTLLGLSIARSAEPACLCAACIGHHVQIFTGSHPVQRELDRFFTRNKTVLTQDFSACGCRGLG
jgi:AcrR family transcriptional regulator